MPTSIITRARLKHQTLLLACIALLTFHTVGVTSQDFELNSNLSTSYNSGGIGQIFRSNDTSYTQDTTFVLVEVNVSVVCMCNSTHVICVDVIPAIVYVPRQAFNITTQHINLSNNSIVIVNDEDFQGVELVEFIDLQNNQISNIEQNAFRNLFRLKYLNLKNNILTDLDPSGLTFQHLASLRYLNLQDNDISTINKFSFLTLQSIAGTQTTTILLTGNPIKCDCNTLALRLWVQTMHLLDLQLNCANDADVLDFKNISFSVFGSCTEVNETLGGQAQCPVCFAEETNYGCSSDAKKLQSCLTQEMVCQKTVSWDASSYRMQINARCESYQKCMENELGNALRCGNNYQENSDLNCNFCCRGPTCLNDTIGGRTKDYTFFLRFLKGSQLSLNPSYMPWEDFIIRGIKAVLTDVPGGKDVAILYERPQTDQYRWVVLAIHVTTFSFIPKEAIHEQLTHILQNSFISLNSYLSREELNSLNLTADDFMEVEYGRECNVSTDMCSEGSRCVPSASAYDGKTRCLCNLSSFYSPVRNICLPVELLVVRNLSVLSSTHDTVNLTWLSDNYGASVAYSIQPSPYQGFFGSIGIDGATWQGLTPGTTYNFTMTSTVSNLISAKVSIYDIWTKALHGNSCDPNATSSGNVCAGKYIECLRAADGVNRCLCPLGYYFHPDQSCHKVEDLQLTNLTMSMTGNRVTLNWFFSADRVNVNYTIQSYPNVGHSVKCSLKREEACWEGLEPGKSYYFSVTAILPASAWYNEQIVSTLNASITLVPVRTVTIFLSYIKHNSTFQPDMADSRTQILAGVQSVIKPLVYTVSGEVIEIVPKINQQLGVTVRLSVTFQPVTNLTQAITQAVLNNSRDPSGFFFQEHLTSLKVYLNYSEVLHGNMCNLNDTSYGNFCAGKYTECMRAADGVNRCLCPLGYYFHLDGSCHKVDELHMTNLTISLTGNNSVTLYWSVDWSGNITTYAIQSSPSFGHLVQNSLRSEKAQWTGLEPGRSYNFTVTSILLPSIPWYNAQNVTSLSALITLETITIFLTYVKQNSTFQPYMNESNSPEFREEQNRIVSGITSTISRIGPPMSGEVLQFEPMDKYQLKVTVQLIFTSSQTEAKLAETINEAVQKNSQDLSGFFFQEKIQSVLVYSNSSVVVLQCPYSTTFLDTGTIAWTVGERGRHSVNCPFNLFQDPAPVATRDCVADPVELLSWTEVNDSACMRQGEVLDNIVLEDLLEVTITTDNAWLVSSLLKSYTDKSENFTSKLVDQTLTLLDKLATADMLKDPVTDNVMNCMSNLIDVDPATLEQSQKESSSSQRLLNLIDTVPARAELSEDKLNITTPNLAIAALHLDALQKEDILLLLIRDGADGQNDGRANIDVAIKDKPDQLDRVAIFIPTQAILDTLSPEYLKKLRRITFASHRTDVLFSTIQKMEIKTSSSVPEERDRQPTGDSSGGRLVKSRINSGVLAASIPGVKVHDLSSNITMTFNISHPNSTNPRCVFWNESASGGKGNWSGEGCSIVESSDTEVTCGCNHLTNFALLMDVYDESSRLSDLDRLVLSVISYVGCAISALALLLTLVTYSIIRRLRRDNPSKILINLCVALLLSNLTFLLGMQDYSFRESASCKAVAVLLHYFLLASLTWMAIEAFYMYLALVVVFKTYFTKFIWKCSLVGWGVPLLIVVITLAVNRTDNYGLLNSGMCWLKNPAFYGAFVAPVCFIMLINYITFAFVIRQLVTMSSARLNKSDKHNTIQRLRGAVGVVTLLGLSWLFAIFAIGRASVVFYYLFAVFNSFQGLFIFIFYCFLKKDVWTSLKRSLVCFAEYGDSTRSQTKGVTAIGHNYNIGKNTNASSSSENSMSTSSTALDPSSRKDSCVSTTSVNKSSSSYSYINPTFVDTENLASISDTPTVLPNEYALWLPGATKSHLQGDIKLKNGDKQDKSLLEYDNLNSLLFQGDKQGGELSKTETVNADSSSFYPYILETFNSFLPQHATSPSDTPEQKEFKLDSDNSSEYKYSSLTPPAAEEPKEAKPDSSHTNGHIHSSLAPLNTEETVDADYINKNINIKQRLKWQASNSSERSGTSV